MNIFVGTLYSGENEYEECLASIQAQTYRKFDHFIFEHLPKLEAHRTLYHSFLDKRDQYDLLIKIDADMVLTSDFLFEGIVEKFSQNASLDVLAIAISDFFSGRLINGLNSYRNTVEWALDPENVNADVVIVAEDRYLFDDKNLAPAAIHCKNSSPYQAFHYGVHKGLKSISPQHSTTHWMLLEKIWENFLKNRDTRIGLAVLGAELVYAGEFSKEDVDYTNPRMKAVLEKYQSMDSNEIEREVKKLRFRNWGILPGDLRRRFLRSKSKLG